jgi:hypothetical protein
MSIRVVNYKKIEMTEDEYNMYLSICKSYDRLNFKGESLFEDLFETDEDGVIIFVRPPSKKQISMEIYMFINSVMLQQHIRCMYKLVHEAIAELKK